MSRLNPKPVKPSRVVDQATLEELGIDPQASHLPKGVHLLGGVPVSAEEADADLRDLFCEPEIQQIAREALAAANTSRKAGAKP